MAATARRETRTTSEPPTAIREVGAPAGVCGDCRHHVLQATRPGSWCALHAAQRFGQPVQTGQEACADFVTWPEGSAAPAFLAAMRL